ncbi:MAG: DEAD/DEAH box helicase, partial [Aquihabitans sp.]
AALGEGLEGGFAGVYPVLKALEERGEVRRGYFVAGLGAAQFALPGAVDRLRSARDPRRGDALGGRDGRGGKPVDDVVVLAATDPAQPYGASLPWPSSEAGRPARVAGGLVALVDGQAAAFVDRGGRSLVTFPPSTSDLTDSDVMGDDGPDTRWAEGLAAVVRSGRRRSFEFSRIDGATARESDHADVLRSVGFVDGYRGLVIRHR